MSDFRNKVQPTRFSSGDSLEQLQCLSLLFLSVLLSTARNFKKASPDPIPLLLVDPVLNWIYLSIINPWAQKVEPWTHWDHFPELQKA
jgi:hypothetical protein